MADLTTERLAEWRATAEGALVDPGNLGRGPWEGDASPDGDGIVWARDQFQGDPVCASIFGNVVAHIIASQPRHLLALLDEVEQLREENARLRDPMRPTDDEIAESGATWSTGWTSFNRMSRRAAISTCIALESMRDRAIRRAELAEERRDTLSAELQSVRVETLREAERAVRRTAATPQSRLTFLGGISRSAASVRALRLAAESGGA